MRIASIQSWTVSIPYNPPVAPYVSSRGVTQAATSLIARLETEDGLVGWGEGGGSFPSDPLELLRGRHPGDIEQHLRTLREAGFANQAISAIEMACWDLLGKAAGQPLHMLLGGKLLDRVELCACAGIKDPPDAAAGARETIERWGFRYLKTKSGRDFDQDLAIARAIQREIGDEARLRPDANCAYSPEEAERMLREVEACGVYAYEDPCSSDQLEALARFREQFDVKIVNNMGVTDLASVIRIVAAGAADLLMPDTTSSGGILPVKQCAAVAAAANVPCVMHCSHDLGLKTAAIAHVAASTPNWVGGSDTTYHGLTDDILREPFVIEQGSISVPTGPGLGVEVDEAKIARFSV